MLDQARRSEPGAGSRDREVNVGVTARPVGARSLADPRDDCASVVADQRGRGGRGDRRSQALSRTRRAGRGHEADQEAPCLHPGEQCVGPIVERDAKSAHGSRAHGIDPPQEWIGLEVALHIKGDAHRVGVGRACPRCGDPGQSDIPQIARSGRRWGTRCAGQGTGSREGAVGSGLSQRERPLAALAGALVQGNNHLAPCGGGCRGNARGGFGQCSW